MPDAVIRAEALTKTYGKARGIGAVSFEVRPGEVFGFLGPNGAGKTTTMRLLLDLLRPTSGSARVFGLDAREGSVEIRARTGYLPADPGEPPRVAARDQLAHSAGLRGGVPWEDVEALARRLQLDLTRPVRALSHGNRQKVGIVQAFMHRPELLILDEPTSGLDPLMQQEFHALVREAAARGATVFLSSHVLPEVEALCDRVGVIREGRLVAVEDVRTLKAKAVRTVVARYSAPPRPSLVEGVAGVRTALAQGHALHVEAQGDLGPLVRALATPDLVDLATREPRLEDIFLGFYGEQAGGGAR